MTKPIDLYYWPTPNGQKISVMLEECALPYTVHAINIGKGEQFAPEFLKISPNNRIPAIVDSEGPDGAPISVFESGAILQYLARKTGKFYGKTERERVLVDEWLFWQVGGLGPMGGQANHFVHYAPEKVPYGITRYTNEVNRLLGVMNRRLEHQAFLAGDYSIADIACYPWARGAERVGQNFADFPHLKRWLDANWARPAVQKGIAVAAEQRLDLSKDKEAQALLFNQKAL